MKLMDAPYNILDLVKFIIQDRYYSQFNYLHKNFFIKDLATISSRICYLPCIKS